jgi:uncharacterized protein with HEPN domain
MPRSAAAYLADVLEACDAIESVLEGVDLSAYRAHRAVRSSVEREFIIIGEAVAGLRRVAPELAANITDARVIVGFRNVLTHEYAAVDDDAVYGVATEDLATLRRECASLLAQAEPAE